MNTNLGRAAQARRYYHHVLNGGTLTAENVSSMVQTIEDLERELAAIRAELLPPDSWPTDLAARATRIAADSAAKLRTENEEMHRQVSFWGEGWVHLEARVTAAEAALAALRARAEGRG